MSQSPDTEYTPATTQVRYAYVTFNRNAFVASTAEHEREFDRWLADLIRRERGTGFEKARSTIGQAVSSYQIEHEVDRAVAAVPNPYTGEQETP